MQEMQGGYGLVMVPRLKEKYIKEVIPGYDEGIFV